MCGEMKMTTIWSSEHFSHNSMRENEWETVTDAVMHSQSRSGERGEASVRITVYFVMKCLFEVRLSNRRKRYRKCYVNKTNKATKSIAGR